MSLPHLDTGQSNNRGSKVSRETEPNLTPEEHARRNAERQHVLNEAANKEKIKAVILQPDLADAALRSAATAKLRKARGGSTRQSFMGQAADTSAIGSW